MNGAKLVIAFSILGAILTLSAPDVRAATYYVDYEAGSDSNSGLSQATAWKHSPGMAGASGIAASRALQPGDNVYFKKGVTWPASALPLRPAWSGTPSQPITFAALSSWGTTNHAIFDGQNARTHAIDLYNYSQFQYLVFDGIWLRNTTGAVFANIASRNITLKNFMVTGCGATEEACVLAYARTIFENGFVDANSIRFGLMVGYANHEIRGNEVVNGGLALIRVQTDSHNTIVERNYLHNMAGLDTEAWGMIFRSSNFGTIRYNLIDLGDGVGNRGIAGWYYGTGNKVYGNTIILSGATGSYGMHWSNQTDLQIFNNIISNVQTGLGGDSGGPGPNTSVDYNLYHQVGRAYEPQWQNNPDVRIGSNERVNQDPRFSGTGAKPIPYYALQSGSPAIDTGNPSTPAGVDLSGTATPRGAGFDIGAVEFGLADAVAPMAPTSLIVR